MPDTPSPAASGVSPITPTTQSAPSVANGPVPANLLQAPTGKVYAFRVLKRYQYSRGYIVKKRLHAAEGNVLSNALAPLIARFAGSKGSQ